MTKYKDAYTEVYEILEQLDEEEYNKIPSNVITAIRENRNTEYEFELDRNALRAIRKHTTSGNYTNFTGKFEIVNGVSVYNSSLFRGLGSTLDSKYINKVGKLGCNNQENDSCNNYSSLTGIGG